MCLKIIIQMHLELKGTDNSTEIQAPHSCGNRKACEKDNGLYFINTKALQQVGDTEKPDPTPNSCTPFLCSCPRQRQKQADWPRKVYSLEALGTGTQVPHPLCQTSAPIQLRSLALEEALGK